MTPTITPQLNLDVSQLKFNDESVRLIMGSLALECHHFAASRGVSHQAVDHELNLDLGVLDSQLGDLFHVVHVPAVDASCLASIRIAFSNEGYRRLADAAKDRMALAFNGERNV